MASAAKFTIRRVGTAVAKEAIQMHGGIGMTWELPLSHFAERLIINWVMKTTIWRASSN